MDFMDKIIIGVGLDEKSYEEDSGEKGESGERLEIDFMEINQQYEELFGRKRLLGE